MSHPLVWAATRPKPEALFPSSMVSRDWAAGGAAGTEEGPESWRASDGGVRSTPRGSSGWPGGVQRASGVGDAGAGGSEVGSVPSSPRPGSGRSMGLGLGGGLAVEATTFTSEDVTRRWGGMGGGVRAPNVGSVSGLQQDWQPFLQLDGR